MNKTFTSELDILHGFYDVTFSNTFGILSDIKYRADYSSIVGDDRKFVGYVYASIPLKLRQSSNYTTQSMTVKYIVEIIFDDYSQITHIETQQHLELDLPNDNFNTPIWFYILVGLACIVTLFSIFYDACLLSREFYSRIIQIPLIITIIDTYNNVDNIHVNESV